MHSPKVLEAGFIFMANILLMAFAVMPHHHHSEQVCLSEAHCADGVHESAVDHSTHDHDHQHDGTGNKHCLLNQLYLTRNDRPDVASRSLPAAADNFPSPDYPLLQEHTALNTIPVAMQVQGGGGGSGHTSPPGLTNGLRAPPLS